MTDEQPNRQNPFWQRRSNILALGGGAAVVLLSLGAYALIPDKQDSGAMVAGTQLAASTPATVRSPPRMLEAGAPFSFADLVERVSPAVVTINVEEKVDPNAARSMQEIPAPFRQFFEQYGGGQMPAPRKASSMGSGFIIDSKGLVVTNNHVIDNASKITVKLPDGRSFTAKLIGADAATDVALLQIKSDKPLPRVEFGDDRQLRVGDWVVAVGNPFGLSNSVTAGIVSSIGRDIGSGPYTDFIQIDAPINRGNSGGPTFDLRGQVIGMNSMIFSPSGGSIGIGFAIPASTIHDVVAQLQTNGKVARGWLGVEIQSITPEIAASLAMKDPKGAIVANVVAGGPAEKAGFKQGDIVVAVNGVAVEDSRDLTRRVAALPAGAKASFSIMRDGSNKTIPVTIAQRKDQQLASAGKPEPETAPKVSQAMGLGLASLTPEIRRGYNIAENINGIVVTSVSPDSDAADKGLRAGDIIMSAGNRTIGTPQDFQARIAEAKSGGRKSILLLVYNAQGTRFVPIDLEQS